MQTLSSNLGLVVSISGAEPASVRLIAALLLLLTSPTLFSAELTWTAAPGFRSAELTVPASGKAGFTLMAPGVTGISFSNVLAQERSLTNQILLNGSGVAAGDVDGDGWCDLYFCRLDGPNALYRNLGNWRFEDVTKAAGVACENLDATGAALVDLDGDGDFDLVVNSAGGGTHVFRNDGHGHFHEDAQVLNAQKGGMSLALGDLDGDGFPDLYVANYRTSGLMDMPNTKFNLKVINGKQVITSVNGRSASEPDLIGRFSINARGGVDEHGEEDSFYRNAGGTNFLAVGFTDGAFLDEEGKPLTSPLYDWGLSVMIRDIDQDGWPDIYVCNDFESLDRIWINQRDGRFRAIPRLALRKGSFFSMGVDFADINRDGFDDFLVLDMLSRDRVQRLTQIGDRTPPVQGIGEIANRPQYMMLNTLYLNRGDGTYAEIGYLSGLAASEWSWAAIFLDVELDGFEDVLVTNGHERASRHIDLVERLRVMRIEQKLSNAEILNARKLFPRLATANVAFRNRGDLTFEETGGNWGFDFHGVSHGMALADLDNDGDQDVVVNNLNDAAGIYRNEASAPRIAVRLKGLPPNTKGLGAKVKVLGGVVASQSQEIISGGRYLSSDDPMRAFAAGSLTNKLRIEVSWRGGKRSVVEAAQANHLYEINEARTIGPSPAPPVRPAPFFVDVSERLRHAHQDEAFDDFALQPLLPHRLSQGGPGLTWWDYDQDGWEDLIIASGKGGSLGIYRNDGKGGFTKEEGAPGNAPVTRDQTTILGWRKAGGQAVLLAGSSNYEDGLTNGSVVRQYDLAGRRVEDSLPGQISSTGPLALGDLMGAGHLSLFVGGRAVPGRFPEAASSLLFQEVNGVWTVDEQNSKRLAKVGMVNGAVFSDLDGDGLVELVLACEWGPIRVFHNERGQLREITEELGLEKYLGWWNGVSTGDFNGDGRMDIVASNWGRNTQYERFRARPLRLYFGDVNEDGNVQLVEAYQEPETQRWVPGQPLRNAVMALPFLSQVWKTHEAYAKASLDEIYGGKLSTAAMVQANWLDSTVFLNLGNRFTAKPLPVEAQTSPAFAVCVGDLDGDGHEDLFLSQNFFGMPPEVPRCDAGRGLWLRGDGNGGFQAVDSLASGIAVDGEQRGAGVCDFDHDGRLDLAVSQNGAQTKLYRNVQGKPGVRLRLKGPPGNPQGIGAAVRLLWGTKAGAQHELHAGSGYWSQDTLEPVLGGTAPTQVWVRWPGGKVVQVDLGPNERVVEIGLQGKLRGK